MKRSHILLFVLLACILLIAPGSAAWLSGGYLYRQEFVVTGDAGWGGSKSNIPVMITCQYETGSSGSGTIYLKNHAQADFDDVRFTTSDGTTLCDYWQQSGFKTDSDYATFWFEAPSLSTGDTTFYIYYGKSSATTASNGSAVFTFFDELDSYDTAKWDTTGTISWSGGGVSLSSANTEAKVLATDSAVSTTDTILTAYVKSNTLGSGSYWSTVGVQNPSDGSKGAMAWYDASSSAATWYSLDSGTTTTGITGVTADVYHLLSIGRWSGANKYYVNETLKATHTTNVYTTACKIRCTADTAYKGATMLWIYIRACPSTFPTYGSVDSEETNPDYEITAGFSANVTSGASPLTVSFTNSTDWGDGGTGSLWWDYDGDGDFDWIDFNGNETPITTYYGDLVPGYVDGIPVEDQVGMYNVSLYAENDYLSDWKNETDYITLEAPDDWFPTPIISANVTSGTVPLTVLFTGDGNNTPTAWAWDIDGDSVNPYDNASLFEYNTQNCTHTFNSTGTYTVRLKVDNIYGYAVATETDYITVSDLPVPPVAAFSVDDTTALVGQTLTFTDSSSNTPTSWAWDFDLNGVNDSVLQNPTYSYGAAGTYSVKLTATNADGSDNETKIDYITVTALVSGFTANDTTVTEGDIVSFTDTSSPAGVIAWWWDFDGDGVTDSIAEDDVFLYTTAGTYTVNHTVLLDGVYDSEVKTNYITVSAPGGPTPTPTPTVGGGLHFSGNVTLIPTSNASQYYDTIMAGNMTMGEIGAIIPQPLVDALGGGDAGWGLLYFIVFGTAFLILFGRQKNVLIPGIMFLLVSFFFVQYILSEELMWIAYALLAAVLTGVIVFLAIGRR